jgi:hypothetical protein
VQKRGAAQFGHAEQQRWYGLGTGSYGTLTVDVTYNNNAGGYSTVNTMIIASDGVMTHANGSVHADWRIVAVAGALTVDSTSTIYEFGTMTVADGGTLTNSGYVDIDNWGGTPVGTMIVAGQITTTGTFYVGPGGVLTMDGGTVDGTVTYG